MTQKDEMSPRTLEMEELENVNGGSSVTYLQGGDLPTGGKHIKGSTLGGKTIMTDIWFFDN